MVSQIIKVMVMFFLMKSAVACADQQDNTAIEKGKKAYLTYSCAVCHGDKGKGDGENAEGFDPFPTNFHDTKGYHRGFKEKDIIHSIKYGIKDNPNSIMPYYDKLKDQELKEISAYLMSLQEKK